MRWSRLAALPPLAALALAALSGGPQASERWAFVLGNGSYTGPRVEQLPNTINDARTIAASLTNMGFRVYLLENGTRAQIEATVAEIGREQAGTGDDGAEDGGAGLGLFFFAGHGLQEAGVNYALPVDVDPSVPGFLQSQAIAIGPLVGELRAAAGEALVVILDSCRNSLVSPGGAFGTGLALTDAPENTIIAYSTAPGEVALDGSGLNSAFTAALASTLEGPRQDLRDVLRLVRAQVRIATGGAQTPWFIDNSRADIIIQPRTEVPLPAAARDTLDQGVSLIATAWRTIAASSDVNDFEQFASLFPDDPLSDIAREQAAVLRAAGPPLPAMEIPIPDANTVVAGGIDSFITACDLLATPPRDQLAIVESTPHDLVNIRAALRACVQAVADNPEDPRLLGILASVLDLAGRNTEANEYYRMAVDAGNFGAYGGLAEAYRFGRGVAADPARAAGYVRLGALHGVTGLRTSLATYYRNGIGVPQSYNEARRWLQLASDFGAPGATVALGDLHRRGEGVPKDPARALEYYRRAAAAGWTDGMNLVGMAYMRGEGVEKDLAQGIAWLSRASEQGNPYAAYHLGRAFRDGTGVAKDPSQAMAYFRLSAQRNFLGAYLAMGGMLLGAGGLTADLPQAFANYTIAAEAGGILDTAESRRQADEATEALAMLRTRMTPDALATGEGLARRWIDEYGMADFARVWQ